MAKVTHLTAIANNEGTDVIVGQINGYVDWDKLKEAKLLYEYEDKFGVWRRTAMVVINKFADFIDDDEITKNWFNSVVKLAWVVLVKDEEWESGLDS
ncbi:MAG: hypothetical protein KGN31_08240 [Betaproteobacteria bacterium]|nr:hypothetical protein [Betaproteobacteria bacterium]